VTRIRDRRLDPDEEPLQWMAALQRSRIPSLFWSAKLDLVKISSDWLAKALLDTTWADDGTGFYVYGPFNTGKSAVAAIIGMEMVRRCERVLWLSVREVPSVRFRENDEFAAINTRLETCDLLVLDDLGQQRFKMDGPAGTAVEDTVRICYERKRPVIYTSNWSWAEMPARLAMIQPLVSLIKRTTKPHAMRGDWGG